MKLLKVPELQHSWQGWLTWDGDCWHITALLDKKSFSRAPDLAGISEWIFVPPKFYRLIMATCSFLEVLRLSFWCVKVLTGSIDVIPRQGTGDRMVW